MGIIYVSYSSISTILLTETGAVDQIFPNTEFDFQEVFEPYDKVITDSEVIENELNKLGINVSMDYNNELLKDWRVNRMSKLLEETGQVESETDYRLKMRETVLAETSEKIRAFSAQSDELVAQLVHAIDDLQKTINLLSNRLYEVYALHFPELVDVVNNPITLARIVVDKPHRSKMDNELLSQYGIPSDKIVYAMGRKDTSLGGELSESDLEGISYYAQTLIYTSEQMTKLENWTASKMEDIAPNLAAVAGSNVGARLISAMGSLLNLAKSHSSKIQIVGAEKALYSALRGRGQPPKHGYIFQIPEIGNAPYWIRGKLARAFASKIVIAARLDVFDGEMLGPSMREELKKYEEELRKQFPQAPT